MADDRIVMLDDCVSWLHDWINENKESHGTPAERNKKIISEKTIFDVFSMLLGFRRVCKSITENGGMIVPSRFNSDIVENVFCQQRGSHGQNDNPTYLQYADGMNGILLGQSITTLKSNTGDVTSFPYCKPKKLHKSSETT